MIYWFKYDVRGVISVTWFIAFPHFIDCKCDMKRYHGPGSRHTCRHRAHVLLPCYIYPHNPYVHATLYIMPYDDTNPSFRPILWADPSYFSSYQGPTSLRWHRLNGVAVPIINLRRPGPRLNIKTVLSTYGDFYVKDKTAVRTSYL